MNDEATLRKNIELWAQQYNRHDAAALAAWYTDDSVYLTPTGLALVGPGQIREYFDASFKRSPKVGIKVETALVRMATQDLAVARGTFEVTDALTPTGQPFPMKGPWVATFMSKDGRWIAVAHGSAVTIEAFAPSHT